MSEVELDAVTANARAVLASDHRQLPRQVANSALAMATELVVLREIVDTLESQTAVLDAERRAAARSADMWKQKAGDGLGVDLTLRLVAVHGDQSGCVVLTRRYPDLDAPAVFHDCLTCCVTWEQGRG
jgi:lactam utilization protein B